MTMMATRETFEDSIPGAAKRACGTAFRLAGGAAVLVALSCLGNAAHAGLHIPLPGPVIGLVLLALGLVLLESHRRSLARRAAALLWPVTRHSLKHMGVLFVPAGVGIVTQGELLRSLWLPILVGLVGSTLIGVAVTGLTFHHIASRKASRS